MFQNKERKKVKMPLIEAFVKISNDYYGNAASPHHFFKRFHSKVPLILFKIPNGTHGQNANAKFLFISYSVNFWQTENRIFLANHSFLLNEMKSFYSYLVISVVHFFFSFKRNNSHDHTQTQTHTQKMCSRFNSIRFAFFVVMHCLHLYLDCFIFIRAVLLQSCKKYSIPHSSAWRGVRVCLQRRAVTNVYICDCTDELAKNYLVCDVIGAFFQNSFRIVSISCIDFVIAFIESEK